MNYMVRHLVGERGPFHDLLKKYKRLRRPYVLTNKKGDANSAADSGGNIYLILSEQVGGKTEYRLAESFVAGAAEIAAGRALWEDEFKYRVASKPMAPVVGTYLRCPALIVDIEVLDYLKSSARSGMVPITAAIAAKLDQTLADPGNSPIPLASYVSP